MPEEQKNRKFYWFFFSEINIYKMSLLNDKDDYEYIKYVGDLKQ